MQFSISTGRPPMPPCSLRYATAPSMLRRISGKSSPGVPSVFTSPSTIGSPVGGARFGNAVFGSSSPAGGSVATGSVACRFGRCRLGRCRLGRSGFGRGWFGCRRWCCIRDRLGRLVVTARTGQQRERHPDRAHTHRPARTLVGAPRCSSHGPPLSVVIPMSGATSAVPIAVPASPPGDAGCMLCRHHALTSGTHPQCAR